MLQRLNKDIIAIIYRYIHRSYTKPLHIDFKQQTKMLYRYMRYYTYNNDTDINYILDDPYYYRVHNIATSTNATWTIDHSDLLYYKIK